MESPDPEPTYADAIAEQGALLDNYFGFIDGTVRPISRPVELQEVVFNGHKSAFYKMSVHDSSLWIANQFGPVGKLKFFSLENALFLCRTITTIKFYFTKCVWKDIVIDNATKMFNLVILLIADREKKTCLHEYFWCCSLRKYFFLQKCPFNC